MGTWRVTTIANPHSRAYALDLWDSMTINFSAEVAVLACVVFISEQNRVNTEYIARRLGDEHYELLAVERERQAILEAFSRHYVLDRSWRELGEPELWTLTIELNECGCSMERTVSLSLRG